MSSAPSTDAVAVPRAIVAPDSTTSPVAAAPKFYRWAKFALNLARSNFETLPHPYKLMFVVTKRCHSQCVYCDIWKAKDDPATMAQELSLAEIRSVAKANPFFQWIDFTGG